MQSDGKNGWPSRTSHGVSLMCEGGNGVVQQRLPDTDIVCPESHHRACSTAGIGGEHVVRVVGDKLPHDGVTVDMRPTRMPDPRGPDASRKARTSCWGTLA